MDVQRAEKRRNALGCARRKIITNSLRGENLLLPPVLEARIQEHTGQGFAVENGALLDHFQ